MRNSNGMLLAVCGSVAGVVFWATTAGAGAGSGRWFRSGSRGGGSLFGRGFRSGWRSVLCYLNRGRSGFRRGFRSLGHGGLSVFRRHFLLCRLSLRYFRSATLLVHEGLAIGVPGPIHGPQSFRLTGGRFIECELHLAFRHDAERIGGEHLSIRVVFTLILN